jgi:crotonobetainyl-CoA:carnitine CoA-transferase CaiB-like acyl-CoA transferase
VPGITGNQHSNIAPYDKFPTKTVDVFIGAGNDRAFRRLCDELGKPQLADDPRFVNNSVRVQHRDELRAELIDAFMAVDGEELSLKLLAAGIPAGPVLNTAQVMDHPHTKHRDMAAKLDWYEGAGIPIKFGRTPGEIRSTPPAFGAQANEILGEHGFDDDEVEALAASGGLVVERRTLK